MQFHFGEKRICEMRIYKAGKFFYKAGIGEVECFAIFSKENKVNFEIQKCGRVYTVCCTKSYLRMDVKECLAKLHMLKKIEKVFLLTTDISK